MKDFIPVNLPLLGKREQELTQEAVATGWLSSDGPFVEEFEAKFAKRMGRRYGIAVANGTAAIDVTIAACGIGPGDEVILPTFTIISCISEIVRSGATPVLVDMNPDTWTMNIDEVRSKITNRTKAIMAVHIYGLPAAVHELEKIANAYGIILIEDAAQMHGQEVHGRPCGSFGLASTFSFYANKHVTTGEGGMILTDDEQFAARCRSLRNLSFAPGRRFVHKDLGWNYRMGNLQAAIGLAQLERLDEIVAIKRRLGHVYQQELESCVNLQLPTMGTSYAENIYWVFGVIYSRGHGQPYCRQLQGELAKQGVGTRPFFWPLHFQPVFTRAGMFRGERYPISERLSRHGFYLPSGVGTSMDDVIASATILKRTLGA